MTYYTWAEETAARELAGMQRDSALARVAELEAKLDAASANEVKLWNVNCALQRRQQMAADCIGNLLCSPTPKGIAWARRLVVILKSGVVLK